jgi:parvulin-like peptidyl-prolyl isomerase
MKKLTLVMVFSLIANIHAAIEILDRVAVIVDDGVIMESQIDSGLTNMDSSI